MASLNDITMNKNIISVYVSFFTYQSFVNKCNVYEESVNDFLTIVSGAMSDNN